jgi:hypothetical protein
MIAMMSPQSSAKRTSRTWLFGVGGLGVVGACLCLVIAAIGIFIFSRSRQPSKAEPAVAYILDASGRMGQPADPNQTRMAVAQAVMAEVIRPGDPGEVSGLRVFGSGAASDACTDTSLVVPFATANQATIVAKLPSLISGPTADASLTEAMIQAMRDLAARTGISTLVVVTGGGDACHPDAEQLIAQEAARAGIKLETFLVGFMVAAPEAQAVKNIVAQAPGGVYLDAPDEATLRNVLVKVQAHVDAPSHTSIAQVLAAATPAVLNFGHSACTMDYWPISAGASWAYTSAAGDWSLAVASVQGDDTSATVTLVREVLNNSRSNEEWECTTTDITPGDVLQAGYNGNTTTLKVVSSIGIWLPTADSIKTGAFWTLKQVYTQTASPAGTTATITLARDCKVNEPESVTVAPGTFDTVRVDCTETRTDAAGATTKTELKSWYAKGVGLVREETSENGGPVVTSELSSYNIPNP